MASPPVLFSAVGLSPKDRQAIIVEAPTVRNKVTHLLKDGLTGFMQSLILNHHHTKEPFYVLDLGVVDNLMDNWTRFLPMIRPFYAVKCNSDPALLAAMATLDMGFDCASQAEIESILALGVSPGRIIFANPCKLDSHIRYAASVGVNLTTFDSGTEVEKIREFHPKCSLLIRIKPPDDGGSMWPLDSKFGARPEEVEPLLQAAKAAQLPVIGVSFHIGSRAACSRAYAVAIEAAKKVFEAAAQLGMPPMRVLDIGGGFTAGIQFEEAASTIRAALKTHFPDTTGMSIIAEPGRFFVESAFTLAANIIGKRVRAELREYWINDGVYGSLMCGALFEPKTLTCKPLACNSNRENPTCEGALTYSSTVFGPTLDALDTVMKGRGLPDLEVNDWLVFPNMGAYSSALRSNFNGFNTSAFSTYLAYSNPS